MKEKYGYTYCVARGDVNETYKHYLRLYRLGGEKPILVEQGLAGEVLARWEKKYKPEVIENPYPEFD